MSIKIPATTAPAKETVDPVNRGPELKGEGEVVTGLFVVGANVVGLLVVGLLEVGWAVVLHA
jgi:hypothetical protein